MVIDFDSSKPKVILDMEKQIISLELFKMEQLQGKDNQRTPLKRCSRGPT